MNLEGRLPSKNRLQTSVLGYLGGSAEQVYLSIDPHWLQDV